MESKHPIRDAVDAVGGAAIIIGLVVWFGPGWCKRMAEKAPTYTYTINSSGNVGCRFLEGMERLEMLRSDRMAYYTHVARLQSVSRCISMKKGQELVIETYSAFRDLYQARAKGDPTSYWIPKQFVAKEKEASDGGQ